MRYQIQKDSSHINSGEHLLYQGTCYVYHTRSVRGFNEFINDCALVNLPLCNARYTYSNMQASPNCCRPDKFLISTEWGALFGLPSQVVLLRVTSDHTPMFIHQVVLRHGDAYMEDQVGPKWVLVGSAHGQPWGDTFITSHGILRFLSETSVVSFYVFPWLFSFF